MGEQIDLVHMWYQSRGNKKMKTGIIRRFDDLGRIVIPKEVRRTMGIHEGDAMEISTDENGIYLSKYQPQFSDNLDSLIWDIKDAIDYCNDITECENLRKLLQQVKETQQALKDAGY